MSCGFPTPATPQPTKQRTGVVPGGWGSFQYPIHSVCGGCEVRRRFPFGSCAIGALGDGERLEATAAEISLQRRQRSIG